MAMSSGKKWCCLTFAERVEVIERSEKGELARLIAKRIGIGKTQIQSIIRDKEKVMSSWRLGVSTKLH